MKERMLTESQYAMGKKVLAVLQERYPHPKTNLVAQNPWQLLVATILSAQCTDARVNLVTPHLFSRWPGSRELALARVSDIEKVIHSVGFFHNKAKNLLACARRVEEVYDGVVPRSLEELMTLAGVARKTANVVLYGAYGINEGLAVDTHVKRISYRIGLTDADDPKEIEGNVNHRMVWYGREVCRARKPLCSECAMRVFCRKRGVLESA